jgi:hypothetical protein
MEYTRALYSEIPSKGQSAAFVAACPPQLCTSAKAWLVRCRHQWWETRLNLVLERRRCALGSPFQRRLQS